MLHVSQLYSGYKSIEVLHDISFSVLPGEHVGILGLNGCGKTTLFRALMSYEVWTKGSILLEGEDLRTMSARKRSRCITMQAQRVEAPIGMHVDEIIAMAWYNRNGPWQNISVEQRERCKEVMESLGIAGWEKKPFHTLSQGQQQRVLLARTFLQQTQCILFDEPDAALDYPYKHELLYQIQEWARRQNGIAISILHDPTLALQYCTRLLLMHDGNLVGEIRSTDDKVQIADALRILYGEVHVETVFYEKERWQEQKIIWKE